MAAEPSLRKGHLRSGYTTGASAAAAAMAAAEAFLGLTDGSRARLVLPGGEEATFNTVGVRRDDSRASAGVVKDAGDDPDVTNGLTIIATVRHSMQEGQRKEDDVVVSGGQGVGTVTLPGLPVEPGQPAINPVPMRMIKEAVSGAMQRAGRNRSLEVIISVPDGEEAAKKTLNARLGIKGGISILGTTGIVKPLSADAWKATITSSMDVARAVGDDAIIISSGRTSERAAMEAFSLPETACAMMGDHVEFSIMEAARHGFGRIIIAAQWAKMVKIAMGTPDTHVRAGALGATEAAAFLRGLGIELPEREFNTAREMLGYIKGKEEIIKVCAEAASYARGVANRGAEITPDMGPEIKVALVSYEGEVMAENG